MKLVLLFLLLISGVYAAPPVQLGRTSYGNQGNTSGSGGTASPGGTVTGANQYRSAGGTFAGDDNVIDSTTGILTMRGLVVSGTVTPISATTAPGFDMFAGFTNSGATMGTPRVELGLSAGTAGTLNLNANNGGVSTFITGLAGSASYIGRNGNTSSFVVNVTNGAASANLHVSGTVRFDNLLTGTAVTNLCLTSANLVVSTTALSGCLGVSDPLVKREIEPLEYGLWDILKVDAITYRDIREGAFAGKQVGVLAYDTERDGHTYRGLEAVMPRLVDQDSGVWHGKKIKAVIYERLPVVLVNAVQTQFYLWLLSVLWLAGLSFVMWRRK